MKKINIAELLKDCPKSLELYSPLCGQCTLDSVDDSQYAITIRAKDKDQIPYYFTADGRYVDTPDAECLLFPSKDQRDWSKFQRPFKDGDIIYVRDEYSDATYTYVAILKQIENFGEISSHCFYNYEDDVFGTNDFLYDSCNMRFATEEEKQKLFDAIKDNGYKWNAETKTLEKLVELKFKVGDKVRNKNNHNVVFTITSIEEDSYVCGAKTAFWFDDQDDYELVPNKFDINTLEPYDKVLVRLTRDGVWHATFFSHYDRGVKWGCYPFVTTSSKSYSMCIPYIGNEHLRGTTNDCDEYYKTW